MSFYFCGIFLKWKLQSQPLPAKSDAQSYDLQQNIDRPSPVNLKGRKKAWVQLNQQYQMWKSAISNYRLTLHCFLFFFLSLSHRYSHARAQTPATEIYLHHRCFYLSQANFSLHSASMYNAFEGYWIWFFSPLAPSIFSFFTVLCNLPPSFSLGSLSKKCYLCFHFTFYFYSLNFFCFICLFERRIVLKIARSPSQFGPATLKKFTLGL